MAANGLWGPALERLRAFDPSWAQAVEKMSTNPWRGSVLPRRFVELVGVGLSAACTNLQAEATRRHIRAALDAGASREEILFVIKCATVMSIHACSLGAPILLEEAKEAGVRPTARKDTPATPACDAVRALGQWNSAWDPFVELDPAWTDEFMATGAGIYGSRVLPAKEIELLSIAFDASFTHMYAPGVRRHIKAAFKAGATIEEVMEVLKLCVSQGVQACNLAVPILAEELLSKG
jgi:alkylhydroperoxidase/carboxymuconolactone decarboxylase family protein YurZ